MTHLKSEPLNRSIVQQVLNVSMENLLFASLDRSIMKPINLAIHALMVIQAILEDHSLVKLVWKVKYVDMVLKVAVKEVISRI